ncbi:MAG: hypothetical protein GF383_00420 [Candidatus Lokiarchaeota archaeon]|nr:hypothetical protein [Candidatus Lokiarchaeota archaeon]MBD3337626.1 hypothetical protein [Candidatus Lokiarchaeota archaeon]
MAEPVEKIKLSTGMEVQFDKKAPHTLFEIMISEILIPKYKENADWNLTLNIILEEMNRLIKKYNLNPELKLGLLNQIEEHLDKDIEELTGVAKIEILFLNMDDYVLDIEKLITQGLSKQDLRTHMAQLIQPLTLFELSELFIYLGKRTFLK